MAQLAFVVFSEQEEFGRALASALDESGHAHVVGRVDEREALLESLRRTRPDALLVDLGPAPHDVLDLLDGIPAPRPWLLVCGPREESRLLLRALQQGVREFLPAAPAPEAVHQAVRRLALQGPASAASPRQAPLLAVLGAKGGVGATFVACQLATALQRSGARTALVDLHLPLGDVAVQLDLRPAHTLAHLVRESDALDATLLRGALTPHRSGCQVLAAPPEVEEAERVSGPHVERILALLREEFDFVVADLSPAWNDVTVRALDQANHALLVTWLDVATLDRARRHLELMRRLGHAESQLHVIANRHARTDALDTRDAARFLGRPVEARLPNDWSVASRSVNEGRTVFELAPGRPLARACHELARSAHAWCGTTPAAHASPGWWTRARRAVRRRLDGAA